MSQSSRILLRAMMVRSWGIFSFFHHRRRTLRNLIYFLLSSAWFFILATGLQQICFYLIILTTIIFHGRTFDKSSPTVTHHNSIPSTLSHFFCLSLAKSQKEITKVCVMKQKVDLLGSVMPEVTIQNMFSNYKSRECHTCMGR